MRFQLFVVRLCLVAGLSMGCRNAANTADLHSAPASESPRSTVIERGDGENAGKVYDEPYVPAYEWPKYAPYPSGSFIKYPPDVQPQRETREAAGVAKQATRE